MPKQPTPEQQAAANAEYEKALEAQRGEGYAPYAKLTKTIQEVATDFDKLSSNAEQFAQHDKPFSASPAERARLFAGAVQDTYIQTAIERRSQDYPEGGVKTNSHGHKVENTHSVLKGFVERELEVAKEGRPSTQEADIQARLKASNEIVTYYESYGMRVGNIDPADLMRMGLIDRFTNGDRSAQRELRTIIREEAAQLRTNESSLRDQNDLRKLALSRTIDGIGTELLETRDNPSKIKELNDELNEALIGYADLMKQSLEKKVVDGQRSLTGTEQNIVAFAENEVQMCAAYLEGVRRNSEAFNPLVEGLRDRIIAEKGGKPLKEDDIEEIREVLKVTGGETKVVVKGTLRNTEVVIREDGLSKTRTLKVEAEDKLRDERSELGFRTAEADSKKTIKDSAEAELQNRTDALEAISKALDAADQNDATEIARLEKLKEEAEEAVDEAAENLSKAEEEFNEVEQHRLQQEMIVKAQERELSRLQDKVDQLQELRANLALKAVQIDDSVLRDELKKMDRFVGIRMARFEDLPANLLNAYSTLRRSGETQQGLSPEIVQRLNVLRQKQGLAKAIADIQSLGKGESQAAADKRVKRYFKQIHHMTHEAAIADARGYDTEIVSSDDLINKIVGALATDNAGVLINDLKLPANVKWMSKEDQQEAFRKALEIKGRAEINQIHDKYFDGDGLKKNYRAVGRGDKLISAVWEGSGWKKFVVVSGVAAATSFSIPEAIKNVGTQIGNIPNWREFISFEKTHSIVDLPLLKDLNFAPSIILSTAAILAAVTTVRGLLNLTSAGDRLKDFKNDARTFIHLTVPAVITTLALQAQEMWMQTASKITENVNGKDVTFYVNPPAGFEPVKLAQWLIGGVGAYVVSKSLLELIVDKKEGLNHNLAPFEKTTIYKWQQAVKKRFSRNK